MDTTILTLIPKLVFKLFKLRSDDKIAVAEYLNKIADLVAKFGPKLRDNAPIDELVSYTEETRQIAMHFSKITKGVLSETELNDFDDKLSKALNAKELLLSAQGDQVALLNSLGEIAGSFRGAATNLLASA